MDGMGSRSRTDFVAKFGGALGEKIGAALDTQDIQLVMRVVTECAQEIKAKLEPTDLTVEEIRDDIVGVLRTTLEA